MFVYFDKLQWKHQNLILFLFSLSLCYLVQR